MTTPSATLQTFDFNSHAVRALEREGQPWFVAADVCRVLEIANHHHAIKGRPGRKNDLCLDEDERGIASVTTPSGDQQMLIINESGLYALIFKSRKPQAQAFRKWVTSEVLPSLRKTGHFSTGSPAPRGVSLDFDRYPACQDFFEIFFCLRDQQIDPNESCSAALRLLHLNLRKRKSLPSPVARNTTFEAESSELTTLFNSTACEKMSPKMSFSEISNLSLNIGIFQDIIKTQNGKLTPAAKSSLGLLLSRHHGEQFSLDRGTFRFEVSGHGRSRWYHLIPVA